MNYRQSEANNWDDWPQETSGGLKFVRPPNREMDVRTTRIDLNNPASVRSVDVISIYPNNPPPPMSVGDGAIIGEGESPARFVVRKNQGGSGGANYTLYTEKTIAGQTVYLLGVIETERDVPSFSETWAVWESLVKTD